MLSSVSGTAGEDVTVYGTISSTGAAEVFLNGENFNFGSSNFMNGDVSDFFVNAPISLTGGTNSGLIALFSFEIAAGTPTGVYGGNFLQIVGGADGSAQDDTADATYSVDVEGTQVPEPNALWLVAAGMAGVIALRRKSLGQIPC